MHPAPIRALAVDLIAQGVGDCEIARRLAIPRTTVRDWRRPRHRRAIAEETCPRCWRRARPIRFTPGDYSELLGLYLGDGCISEGARTQRLRLTLDARYHRMNAEIRALMERCFPQNRVGSAAPSPSPFSGRSDTAIVLSVYSTHLACLFPQHGPGKKHERRIALEGWQRAVMRAAPWAFIRGCICSDGCAFINRTGPYEYLSYDFGNMSKDIVGLFTDACDLAGVRDYRARLDSRGAWDVRINRRGSVRLMLKHVGLKS